MKEKIKIAVLVSGGGTNLQALIDAQTSKVIKSGEIVLTVSSSSKAFALTRAKKAGIDCAVCERKSFPSQDDFEDAIEKQLESHGAQLIVLAGFMCILSEKFTSRHPEKIINVHPSLIPSFCGKGYYGLRVHEAALSYGVKVTGATVHFVNEIPDGGKIIMQKAVDILEDDTPKSLQKRVMEEAEWKILPLSVEKVCSKLIKE